MSSHSGPHDAVFRRVLGEPANAASQLRAVLPHALVERLELDGLTQLVGETPTDELHDLVAQLGPEAEEAHVTTAEMLRAEGEARGRTEALVQLVTLKFGPLPQAALETVQAASTEQLEAWTARVLTADTLDDILR